jgi:predicted naringenin-chalcone synthase
MSTPAIVSLCCVTPRHSAGQAQAARFAISAGGLGGDAARFAEVIYRRSGVDRRASSLLDATTGEGEPLAQTFLSNGAGPTTGERMVRYGADAVELACEAARGALAGQTGTITHLVTVSCTGFIAPGIDHALIERLGLDRTVRRLHVGYMGCHGAVNGLAAARAIVRSEPASRVLLVCVEVCSLHFQASERHDQIVANALFADGAAAAVVAAGGPASFGGVAATGGCVFPDSAGAMGWRIGDHGFEMTLAESVPRLIGEHLRPWLASWLDREGVSLKELVESGGWAVHPGGPRVLDAVASSLGLSEAAMRASRSVLADHGNMSSPTVLFILERLRRQAEVQKPTVLLAFGPGLSAEAALLAPA